MIPRTVSPKTTRAGEAVTATERVILHDILLALGARSDLKVWRVNVVVAKDRAGQWLRSGPDGSADISGILAPSGRRLELEVKSATGRVRPEQEAFLAMVRAMGGVGEVVRSVQEAEAVLTKARAEGPLFVSERGPIVEIPEAP